MNEIVVGCYVIPDDASPEVDNVHALEGTVWAVEQQLDQETGELVDHLHVVRVWQGHLEFRMLPMSRAGTVSPASPATLDGLLKMAGKTLLADGRKTEQRVFGVVHSLAGVVRHMPKVDVPSVFDHGMTVPEGEEAGWQRHTTQTPKPVGSMAASMLAKLLARFEQLDHTACNEVRREARAQGLAYLETDSPLSLRDVASYDVLITRWEQHQAKRVAS